MDRLPAIVEPAIARLRELEPEAIAVLVGGSYAKGTFDELSDLDLTAIVEQHGGRYLTWFQDVDPLPDLVRCLIDGTLERQLAS